MAVYAGMVDAMDHHIGRLVDHIDSIGELENTVFIFLEGSQHILVNFFLLFIHLR